jgi:peptidylprolyl isomerase
VALFVVGVLIFRILDARAGKRPWARAAMRGPRRSTVKSLPPGVTVDRARDLSAKPKLTVDTDVQPPRELVTHDLVKGRGREVARGRGVNVQYVGVSWSTGREFDASWDRGQPFSFTVGGGRVIPGWDQGLAGIRENGRRLLVIPPDLGYGARGAGKAIPPDETLVFVVDTL